MLLGLTLIITLLSFFCVGFINLFKVLFRGCEKNVMEQSFLDRTNKEKYLEEIGFNVMNDPW